MLPTKVWTFRDERPKWIEAIPEIENEPDKKQWEDKDTKLPCIVLRGPLGAWCGYVGVSKTHQYYGKEYSDLPFDISAHSDVNFSRPCEPGEPEHGICHVTAEEDDDSPAWWFGFDCAHAWDRIPGMSSDFFESGSQYRNFEYVQAVVTGMAASLKQYDGTS